MVFALKYRRKVFYGEKRYEIGQMLRKLSKWKGVNVLEAEVYPDHICMLAETPPKISVAGFMGFLKGKSGLLIYEQWSNIRDKCRSREFWCKGYYVDMVRKNTKKTAEYIRHQLEEDTASDQLRPDISDPFTE